MMTDAPFEAVPEIAGPDESVVWSYFKACLGGLAMSMTVSSLLAGASFLETVIASFFEYVAAAVVTVSLAPALAIPIRILAGAARVLRLPRGVSDIAIGALCGGLMMLPDLSRGAMPGPMSWGFLIGGGFGGFLFWRARACPDAQGRPRNLRTALEEAREALACLVSRAA